MAAVDHAVADGVADSDRLAVGGWSYGGILTDYVITKTGRFKAAVSGASIANMLAGYGTDHYQYEYEVELGLPWKTRELWLSLSSSYFDVEKVTTPTLFLCGALDMNVPLLNTEQLYQALRRVGRVDTELVVYPDQWHCDRDAQLPEGSLGALPRVVRPLPAAERRRRRPQARGDVAARPAALRARRAGGGAPGTGGEARPGHERVREEPGQRGDVDRPGPPVCRPRPVPRGDRRVHARPRDAPGRRAALSAPRPPLHHASRARQGGRRSLSCGCARGGPSRRARAGPRPHGAALDHAAVHDPLSPRPRPLPEGGLRLGGEGVPPLPRAGGHQR